MSIKDSIGNVAKLLVKVHDADLKAQLQEALLSAQGEGLDLQERVAELQEENARLRGERDARDEVAKVSEQLFYARNAYWRKDETIDSAYCPTCWDTKRFLVHLTRERTTAGLCYSCKSRHHFVYNGPRPNEGDVATPDGSASPASPTKPKPSRRQTFRGL